MKCVSLDQLEEAADRPEAALSPKQLFDEMLAGLCRGKGLVSSARCVRERMSVDGIRVFDGDVRVVFVRTGFVSGGFSC